MRILFLSNLYPPNVVGGYEQLCYEAARDLAARGHEVSVLTSNYGGKVQAFSGQRIERTLRLLASETDIYLPFDCPAEERAAISAHNAQALARMIEECQPHVIFAWNLYFLDQSFLRAVESSRKPVVYLLTDNWLIAFLNLPFIQIYMSGVIADGKPAFQSIARSAHRWLDNRKMSRFTIDGHAIFSSRFMRDLYNEAKIVFNGKSLIVHHGVDLASHSDADFVDRGQLLKHGELRLLVAGRLVEIKGVHTAIEALPAVIGALPGINVKLTLLGDARDLSYKQRLCLRIEHLGIADKVQFSGPVQESELFKLFQAHDIYLFPSLYEPFSLTLIHALGAGIPTIASDAGGNREMITHKRTGILFPKGNPKQLAGAIIDLATDHALRSTISQNARSAIKSHTFQRELDEMEQSLKAVL